MPDLKGMMRVVGNNKKAHGLKDSDGDGVINILDCKPYNPREQGISHSIGQKIVKLIPSKELRHEAKEYVEHKRKVAVIRKETRREEELKHAKELEEYKAKTKLERRKKYMKEGGFWGSVSKGLLQATKPPKHISRKGKVKKHTTRKRSSFQKQSSPRPLQLRDLI